MEAISKKSGKKFTGKLAALMLRIGAATPVEETPEELDLDISEINKEDLPDEESTDKSSEESKEVAAEEVVNADVQAEQSEETASEESTDEPDQESGADLAGADTETVAEQADEIVECAPAVKPKRVYKPKVKK